MGSRPCPACGDASGRSAGEKSSHELVRCRACGTLHTAHTPQSESLQAFYDGYYADANLDTPAFLHTRLDEIVRGFAAHRREGRLLDVGFGAGALLDAARRAGWTASGTEISETALVSAAARGLDVSRGTLEEVRYPSGTFDVVTAVELLEHVLDPLALLIEIRRVLRPGGMLWATTPHGRGISARLLGIRWSVVAPPEHMQLFSIRGMHALLRRAGYRDVALAAHGVNPYEIAGQVLRRREPAGTIPVATNCRLNESFSTTRSRRWIKRVANTTLSVLRLGDSLKVRALA